MNILSLKNITLLSLCIPVLFTVSCARKNKDELPVVKTNPVSPAVKKPVSKPVTSKPYTPKPTYSRKNPNLELSSKYSGAQTTISRGNSSLNYVALTFDDGPHPVHTPRLLDMLKRANVKATFYVVGSRVKLYPHIVARMVAEGHEIGNHTWNHPNLSKMSPDAVRRELNTSRDAIVAATGVKPRTMRPPYGALTPAQRTWIKGEYGYSTILWSVDPQDWKYRNTATVTNNVLKSSGKGSLILLHDIHRTSVDAVPAIVDTLLGRGLRFVTVSQLIASK